MDQKAHSIVPAISRLITHTGKIRFIGTHRTMSYCSTIDGAYEGVPTQCQPNATTTAITETHLGMAGLFEEIVSLNAPESQTILSMRQRKQPIQYPTGETANHGRHIGETDDRTHHSPRSDTAAGLPTPSGITTTLSIAIRSGPQRFVARCQKQSSG